MPDPTIPELAAWCRRKSADLLTGGSTTDGMNLRAIAAALESMQWRPIAEAPRDGTTIIVGCHMPAWGWVQGWARWDGAAGIYGWISRGFFDPPGNLGLGHPTHFMPLRPPPAEKEPDR